MSKGLQLGSLGGVQYPNLSQREDRKDRAALLSQEDPNSEAETVDRFVRWRVLFVLLNIAACITCAVTALQLSWRHSHYLEALSPAVDNLKTAISVLTLLMIIQMTEMAWYRHINSPEYLQDPEDQSALGFLATIDFWLEVGVCLLHCPPPWIWHSAPEEWNLFVLARCYWLVRFFYLFSSVYRDRRKVQLLVQNHDAYLSGPQEGGIHLAPPPYNYSTMAKVYFTEHAWSLLFWSTIVVFLTLSYAVYVCERAEQPELFTYGNSVYFTATMVTTIGSSLQPNHPIGRLLSLIASLFGVAFLSLSVVVLLDTLRLQGDMELACMDMFSLIKTERRNQKLADARKSKLAA